MLCLVSCFGILFVGTLNLVLCYGMYFFCFVFGTLNLILCYKSIWSTLFVFFFGTLSLVLYMEYSGWVSILILCSCFNFGTLGYSGSLLAFLFATLYWFGTLFMCVILL